MIIILINYLKFASDMSTLKNLLMIKQLDVHFEIKWGF